MGPFHWIDFEQMRWDSNPTLRPRSSHTRSANFSVSTTFRCAANTPHNLSTFIAVPVEQFQNLARPERFELPTPDFVGQYSIHLSYGRIIGFWEFQLSFSRTHRDCLVWRSLATLCSYWRVSHKNRDLAHKGLNFYVYLKTWCVGVGSLTLSLKYISTITNLALTHNWLR